MRLSQEITGWAFLAEVEGVRRAGLAVGLSAINPFTTAGGSGGSLFARAHAWGLPELPSLDELPFDRPVDPQWCVVEDVEDEEGALFVVAPDGAHFAYDLALARPPGWSETARASGTVVLVVSHVLPLTGDPLESLVFETRQGLVCAGPVRFGEPERAKQEEQVEGGGPTARFLIDPVGDVQELVLFVCDRILSMDEAKRRARELERTRRALARYATGPVPPAGAVIAPLFREEPRDHRGPVEFRYVYWRLVAEVADACGDRTAWRTAALRTVETAAPLLSDRCSRAVFEEADAVATRLIDDPDGTVDDKQAALLAAARLRMASRGPEDLAADAYAREDRTTWFAHWTAELYRTWFTDEEPFQAESPRLVVEAGELVVRALELTAGTGPRRPRLLATLAQVLADGRGVHREAAEAAFSALIEAPALDDPDIILFLLRVLEGVPPETTDGLLTAVFGTDLADFVAAYGPDTTARVIGQGLNLARERADRPLLRRVLDWAERLDVHRDPAHRRQLIEARLHALPDDPTDCPAPGQELLAPFPDSWAPSQRSAALLHAAAHARERGRPALGLALLRGAGGGSGEGLRLLTADLYHQAAEAGEPADGPVPFPWGYYTYAAVAYASLGFEELARASLVPFVQRVGSLEGEELRKAVHTLVVDVPHFDTSGMPGLGGVLRDLVHTAVWQLAAHGETLPMDLMLGLHQAGKGSRLGVRWRIEGPIALPPYVRHFLGKLRDRERPTALGGASANLLTALEADHRPGGGDDAQIARNLRWRISAFIDDELRRRSVPFADAQHLWGRVHELLDERTVLLTWFLPAAVNGGIVLLAVTRQGRELTVYLGDGGEEDDDRHPVADEVEAIRAEVERDPLFGDVTPEGRRLLEADGLPLGPAGRWAEWRARGKDRVLVWPHGALHYLPLHLCGAGGRMIADDWTVTTVTGLEALAPAGGPARPRRTAVLASALGGVPYGLPAEPALEEHARDLAGATGAEAITGAAATRDRLLAELSTADVVHIAAHGTADQDAPWLHCLHLTPGADDDGRVFAYDFLETDLRGVRLVTLAACDSALGRFDRGDNVRGIPSALLTAGARAVVGCLWPVRPEPATYFFHHLHQRVARAVAPEDAFREAQLATRAAHPHYRDWGAFTYLRGRGEGAVE